VQDAQFDEKQRARRERAYALRGIREQRHRSVRHVRL
jgi:hypothetical protein